MSQDKQWNHEGLICQSCSIDQTPTEQCFHVRGGKTKHERDNGTHGNRLSNRAERQSWQKSGGPFPRGSCNGKKNRFHV